MSKISDSPGTAAARFYQRVYAIVRAIPPGRVTTYGAIANALGAPGYARHVGTALAAHREPRPVPAHRVVNHTGALSGRHAFGEPDVMRSLLEREGVSFREDGRVNLAQHLWIPPFEGWTADE